MVADPDWFQSGSGCKLSKNQKENHIKICGKFCSLSKDEKQSETKPIKEKLSEAKRNESKLSETKRNDEKILLVYFANWSKNELGYVLLLFRIEVKNQAKKGSRKLCMVIMKEIIYCTVH
jgi:hypothetical protein